LATVCYSGIVVFPTCCASSARWASRRGRWLACFLTTRNVCSLPTCANLVHLFKTKIDVCRRRGVAGATKGDEHANTPHGELAGETNASAATPNVGHRYSVQAWWRELSSPRIQVLRLNLSRHNQTNEPKLLQECNEHPCRRSNEMHNIIFESHATIMPPSAYPRSP
jgi:hypothetical protein